MNFTNSCRTWAFLSALASPFFLTGPSTAQDDVVVGFAVSESGWQSAYAAPATNAAMLAIDDINAKGGVLGRKIKPLVVDAKSDRVESAKAGNEVLGAGAELVVVDCDYDFGAPAALAAKAANKVAFFLCAESVLAGIQGVGKNAFSASVLAPVQGATVAEWGVRDKGWKSAYILLDTTIEYNKGVCYGFDWMWREKLGLKLLGHDVFQNGDTSIASQISRIKALSEQPDVIMMCSYVPGAASAIRQLRAAGITSAIGGGSAMSGSYWLDTVPNLSSHYIPEHASIYGDDPRPEVNEFNRRYKERFGEQPPSSYAYPGYLVIQMWALAAERAGTLDTDAVIAELEKFKDEPLLIGSRTFTSELHHQNYAPYAIMGVEAGKPKYSGSFTISEPVPMDVLLGKRYSHLNQ